MSPTSIRGVVSVSIDTDRPAHSELLSLEAVESVVVELFDRFQKQRLAATWMIGDPKRHALADRIVRTGSHELALGQDSASNANQCVLGRLLECQRAGLTITTAAENRAWQQRELELLAKHGITVLRAATSGDRGIQAVKYGVWRVPISTTVCGGGWMPYFAQLQRSKRTIDQALGQSGICHVRIDAASMARSDVAGGLRAIERFLMHLNMLRTTRAVTIETLRETALRLQPRRNLAAAQSILRAA